jgi:hypothetical protein
LVTKERKNLENAWMEGVNVCVVGSKECVRVKIGLAIAK